MLGECGARPGCRGGQLVHDLLDRVCWIREEPAVLAQLDHPRVSENVKRKGNESEDKNEPEKSIGERCHWGCLLVGGAST